MFIFTKNINLLNIGGIIYPKVHCFTQRKSYTQNIRNKITLKKTVLEINFDNSDGN